MNVIIFLIVLVVLILVHEFGHFIVAKKFGVRVDEFGIGFPPKLWGVKHGETEYTINALPFGGFVKIFGEDMNDESIQKIANSSQAEKSFVGKPKLIQAAIIVAGVFFNFLLAWLLFSFGFMTGLPMPVGSAPRGAAVSEVALIITGVEKNSPADYAGLKTGDKIVSLQRGAEALEDITIPSVQSFIGEQSGKEIAFTFLRGKEEFGSVLVVPIDGLIPERAAIGISMDMVGTVNLSLLPAVWEGMKIAIFLTGIVIAAFAELIAGAFSGGADLGGIAGPVGIVALVGDAVQFGFVYLLGFVAIISVNLAVLNLIPFPALDGGRLLFLVIEAIKGSPLNQKVVSAFHTIGFFVLILLLLLVTYNDIMRLIIN